MKIKFTLPLGFLALAATFGAHAQTTSMSSTAPTATGLLGHRYGEVSVGALDPHGVSDLGFAAGLNVNIPLQPGLDVGFGYGYTRINADFESGLFEARGRDHAAYASATAYSDYRGMKPFFGAALGYQWSKTKLSFGDVPVFDEGDDEALWGLGVGVEIPVGRLTLTPSVTYQDGFKSGSASGFAYSAEAHTWFTPRVGGFAEATYMDPTGGDTQAWSYTVGVRLRF